MLLAQLTALDEQSALFSCLAFGRTLSEGVDLAGRSFADLFAGSSTVADRKEPAHYTSSEARKAGLLVYILDDSYLGLLFFLVHRVPCIFGGGGGRSAITVSFLGVRQYWAP